jgi:hypothetical protein
VRIYVVSDLHLEAVDVGEALPAPKSPDDVLVVPGDVCIAGVLDEKNITASAQAHRMRVDSFFSEAKKRFSRVIFVLGNHEYYNYSIELAASYLRGRYPDIDILDNGFVDIGGIRFIGSTLWSDFEGGDPDAARKCEGLPEFKLIVTSREMSGLAPVLMPEDDNLSGSRLLTLSDAFDLFNVCSVYVSTEAERASRVKMPCVVVTHHAPSFSSAGGRATSIVTGAYCSNLEDIMEGQTPIKLWLHGRTHHPVDYMIDNVRVASNPRGYQSEPSFGAFSWVWFEIDEHGDIVADHTDPPSPRSAAVAAAEAYLEKKSAARAQANAPLATFSEMSNPALNARPVFDPARSGSGGKSMTVIRHSTK